MPIDVGFVSEQADGCDAIDDYEELRDLNSRQKAKQVNDTPDRS